MTTPSEKLAQSLEVLKSLQDQDIVAVRSRDLSRTHRERLINNGFLWEVIKGWYIRSRPDEAPGESTSWYASFWDFCASYLESRFGAEWCLSAEQSLALHTGNRTVPKQLLVRTRKAKNNVTNLPFDTSILDIQADIPNKTDAVIDQGLRLFSLPAALIACAPSSYRKNPTDFRAALATVRDPSDLLERLLQGGHSTVAGRLAAAFRNIGRVEIADAIVTTMKAAGYYIRETDPFEMASPLMFTQRVSSPYVTRIQLMWQRMRDDVLREFPPVPETTADKATYLKQIEDIYTFDAYHSLSIEGYRVSLELIERVKSGVWNPDTEIGDRDHHNAMAARGYWQAFQSVKQSIEKILAGGNPGTTIRMDHPAWYRELFAPSVTAGILRAGDLAGYRNGPVYIRQSMHVPPNKDAVRDLMSAFFDLLEEETEAAVRVVLGHFVFVYIHPYIDGNGRIGRFLMNAMMASGGYPWTIIPIETRSPYMAALEAASMHQDITIFARFLAGLIRSK